MSAQTVFITGGSEGIGKEVGREFLKSGAHVVLFSRSNDKLQLAIKELGPCRQNPSQILSSQTVDVTDWEQTKSVFEAAIEKFGTPDVLVNCAGYARPGYIDQLDMDQYRKMMDLNYFGIVHTCKAVIPAMVRAKKGKIVNTSSMAGFIGLFGYTGYCASKFAVVGFSEALRRELEVYGIHVSVLAPPNTMTPGLEEENKFKSAEILKTEEKAKPVEASEVAKALLRELPKNKFMINPTFDGALAYRLARHTPAILNQFVKRKADGR